MDNPENCPKWQEEMKKEFERVTGTKASPNFKATWRRLKPHQEETMRKLRVHPDLLREVQERKQKSKSDLL